MKRIVPRVTVLLLFTIIGVLVGMEWTRLGIERVYGPMPQTAATEAPSKLSDSGQQVLEKQQWNVQGDSTEPASRWETEWNQQMRPVSEADHPNEQQTAEEWEEQMPEHLGLPPIEEPPVNQLADKTAGFLSRLSEAGIQAVVGIFDRLF
ncbi:hypothetical protein [Paenibacillus agilis]|uniref:DUF3679 domain-containing protein n=1 Tax=Paenibacillus agilis TaxID=3020863 RepID=A0A559J394_9BACL|nr:hypothetical protein [Paenibacillus agilis]TVX94331.1 hypothetical protein FPZ44_15490 [Paenibacillus agilis]